jgi:hypothetical protein
MFHHVGEKNFCPSISLKLNITASRNIQRKESYKKMREAHRDFDRREGLQSFLTAHCTNSNTIPQSRQETTIQNRTD